MPVAKLKDFLDQNQVKYVTIAHSRAFTAQEIAQSAHIPGNELAKAVMVRTDGRLAMAVLPASYQIDFDRLRQGAGVSSVELASEKDFQDKFPGCELGAMPPFGNLYAMDVYVSQRLTEDRYIAFSAGSHTELIKLSYADYERLVRPNVIDF